MKDKEIFENKSNSLLETITLSEVSQKEKDKYHTIPHICRIQNIAQANLSTKQKQTHGHREKTCGCQWGASGGGMD